MIILYLDLALSRYNITNNKNMNNLHQQIISLASIMIIIVTNLF